MELESRKNLVMEILVLGTVTAILTVYLLLQLAGLNLAFQEYSHLLTRRSREGWKLETVTA